MAAVDCHVSARTALQRHDYKNAVRWSRLAIQRRGDWHFWYYLGIAYQGLGRWEDAASSYEAVLALNHDHKDAQGSVANLKLELAERPPVPETKARRSD